MEPHATLAAGQALVGIVLLTFIPLVLATVLHPLRERSRR
jgi:predicted Na+-dependent transporter